MSDEQSPQTEAERLVTALASDTTAQLATLAAEWGMVIPRGQFGGFNWYKLIIELAQKVVGDD